MTTTLISNRPARSLAAFLMLTTSLFGADLSTVKNPLHLPAPADYQMLILSPNVLQLTLITTKPFDMPEPHEWNFVSEQGLLRLPSTNEFAVRVGGGSDVVSAVGFKRRVLYAPLRRRDLRIANELYLQLTNPVEDGQTVAVTNPSGRVFQNKVPFSTSTDPNRLSPVIHVNQIGYLPGSAKTAMVGSFLGSLGELVLSPNTSFALIEADSGREVYHSTLHPRLDRGFDFPSYQHVLEADFSEFKIPGEYRLRVAGLGASFPFFIDDGAAAALARAYALGLYHQRCGTANELPFTRFTHGPCHTAPADVPTMRFEAVQKFLAEETATESTRPSGIGPRLKDINASLYPFIRQGKIDVSGGHHDAGDYSKYTINSAALIHHLVFAADAFPGVGELDNLGLPESGDGKSDLLQEAKWEADFLVKMQDEDGGFYFLVYPRDRRYEDNVLPDHGDPQVVWPKNTAATAAAVAALAQTSSSPLFKAQFPDAAKLYLQKAMAGWDFLKRAMAKFGKDGAYQKITHYGDDFAHDDELAWAACEMFLATGDASYQKNLIEWFNPTDSRTRKWSWWRLYGSYGCAIRSYAFAAKTHRANPSQLDALFLSQCEKEIVLGGEDQLHRAQDSAYGTSLPIESKRVRAVGWYFSADQAFDLAVASLLDYPPRNDPRQKFMSALLSNLNYEAGCNPVNVCFVTGLGWRRPREIVHHYALNDRRILPPSGLPVGNIQSGFGWLQLYQRELGAMSYPSDGDKKDPYPFYDRWGDSFNVQTEYVVTDLARGLATAAFLMARTPLKLQPWKPGTCQIQVRSVTNITPDPRPSTRHWNASVPLPAAKLANARVVWEAEGQEPALATDYTFESSPDAHPWIEVEVQWPDGRRLFGVTNLQAQPLITPETRSFASPH